MTSAEIADGLRAMAKVELRKYPDAVKGLNAGAEALELVADFDAHLRTLVDGAAECTRNEYESGMSHGMQSILDHWEALRATRKVPNV